MKTTLTRRRFIQCSFPLVLSSSVLGRAGTVGPNSRVGLACVGVGGQGTSNLRAFLADERVQVVAVCDADAKHLEAAAATAKLGPADGLRDFREVIARKGVDALMIATPDHWHAYIAVTAAKAGKDLFSEKPLAASIAEGRAVCRAVEENRRILQCGTWRRSRLKVRLACELVRNRRIGELRSIEVGVPGKFAIRGGFTGLEGPQPVPAHFDYAMWQGPAPERPYTEARCHFNFRWVNDYAPGYITDWGAHFLDVAQWGAGMDDTTPVAVEAHDVRCRDQGIYDAPEEFRIEYRYANGVRMTMVSTTDPAKYGTKFIGSEGWIFTENDTLQASDPNLLRAKPGPSDVRLFESNHHHRNFIDAVLSRGQVSAPASAAQRAATVCYLGSISAALKRPLKFDPAAERFVGDDEANARLAKAVRPQWKVA